MAKEVKETFSSKQKDLTFDHLDLEDENDKFTFEMYCARVYDVLALKSPKEADHLYQSERFWTKKSQLEYRQQCRENIFCHLEETCGGEAVRNPVQPNPCTVYSSTIDTNETQYTVGSG
jgi:hypothetical protein